MTSPPRNRQDTVGSQRLGRVERRCGHTMSCSMWKLWNCAVQCHQPRCHTRHTNLPRCCASILIETPRPITQQAKIIGFPLASRSHQRGAAVVSQPQLDVVSLLAIIRFYFLVLLPFLPGGSMPIALLTNKALPAIVLAPFVSIFERPSLSRSLVCISLVID